jgi:uncharacterized lipoprotein
MTMFSKIARVAAPLAFAALFGLAACSKDPAPEEPENYTQNDSGDEAPPEAAPQTIPDIVNETPPPSTNVAVADPVDVQAAKDQQMQEDADASGMTSRLPPPDQTVAANDGAKPK